MHIVSALSLLNGLYMLYVWISMHVCLFICLSLSLSLFFSLYLAISYILSLIVSILISSFVDYFLTWLYLDGTLVFVQIYTRNILLFLPQSVSPSLVEIWLPHSALQMFHTQVWLTEALAFWHRHTVFRSVHMWWLYQSVLCLCRKGLPWTQTLMRLPHLLWRWGKTIWRC